MRISITGHTHGFGKYINETLAALNHTIVGFSKSNGFDISNGDDRYKIINLSSDCDVFINNAHYKFFQTEILYELHKKWAHSPKMIINIGSHAKDFCNVNKSFSYAIQKTALNEASKQLGRINTCKVICIDFGFLSREESEGTSIGYNNAFEYILLALGTFNKNHRLLEITVANQ
jgi:hypothetical protein